MAKAFRRSSTSALSSVDMVVRLLFAEPTQLVFSGRDFGNDLPAGVISVRTLRGLLLAEGTSLATRDAVWRELIARARKDRSTWRLVAVWMAIPGLRRWTSVLAEAFAGDVEDLESEIVEGFLRELDRVDVATSSLAYRLVRAGHKAGTRLVYAEAAFDGARWLTFRSHLPRAPWGHPDLVLLDAVAAGVITLDEAKLIATTRLENVPINRVAVLAGERTNTVVVRRRRAEQRLARAIAEERLSRNVVTSLLEPVQVARQVRSA